MVELDMSEQGGSMYLHDIMAGFVAELDWKGRD
jgi:hypothetical protein